MKFPRSKAKNAAVMIKVAALLIPVSFLGHNSAIAATSAVRIDLLKFTKRTALLQRYFHAQNLYDFYGSVRGRTLGFAVFFVSGKVNPAYTVALLFDLNGGSQTFTHKGDCNV